MKYYIEPPRGADLGYGYEQWMKRPEEKGRIDTLCEAWTRIRDRAKEKGEKLEVGVVCWRGVMTK
jgi:RAT1-interacting protein